MILPKEIRGVHLVSWFPGVVTFGVAPPLYEIVELLHSPLMAMVPNLLHLVLFFVVDQVRRGSGVVGSVGVRLSIWGKEGCVEHRMDQP
jgi:hypothetical protein